ncbi:MULTISPECIES: glycosyltransferase family 2 protein [Nostocales]|uniref:Glycosyltransferase n=3 Tax=Nostocales TaxID=1161 RepID=A0A0C1R120_9CYAN|nr:glycosyltransferase family 2 protein [Tolypothrix bouteillei]KAF3885276.1 glycosyltransferase family 2 protein [Tolypothrix bouteillei VB521301]
MNKLLTIAIPTYNRAELLDRQLAWIAQAIQGFESECEIYVSDNCSTDNTQEIIKKWQTKLNHITFNANKNPENLGVMPNIINCLKSAKTKYVWAIGDDDPIENEAVPYIFEKIKKYEDLSLLFLNFSGRNKTTGEPVHPPTIIGNRWFDIDSENGDRDGKAVFEHCFTKSVGAVIFLTASIYRTDLVQSALQKWEDAAQNWISLAYIAGYCAANGRVIVTKKTYVECIVGVSYWQKEQKSALLMQYKHITEVLMKLEQNGYSKQYCRQMVWRSFQEANWKVLFGALRRWPMFTIKTVVPFFTLVVLSVLDIMGNREMSVGEYAELSTKSLSKNGVSSIN